MCQTHDIRFELIKEIIPLVLSLWWTHVCISPSFGSFASNIYPLGRRPTLDIEFVSFWRQFSLRVVKTVEINIYRRLRRLDHNGTVEIIFDECRIEGVLLLVTGCIWTLYSVLLFVVSRRDKCVIVVLTRFGFIKKVGYTYDIAFHFDIILRPGQTRLSRIEVIFYRVFLTLSFFHLVLHHLNSSLRFARVWRLCIKGILDIFLDFVNGLNIKELNLSWINSTYRRVDVSFSFEFVINTLFNGPYRARLISKNLCHFHKHSHLKLISSCWRRTCNTLVLKTLGSSLTFYSRWSCNHPSIVITLHSWFRVSIDLWFTLAIKMVKHLSWLLHLIHLLVIVYFFRIIEGYSTTLTDIAHRRF